MPDNVTGKPFAPGFPSIRMRPRRCADRLRLREIDEEPPEVKPDRRKLSEDKFIEHRDAGHGYCLSCRRWNVDQAIDADADGGDTCERCGSDRVVGAEHALNNDFIEVLDA